MRLGVPALLGLLLCLGLLAPGHAAEPIEDYSSYQPAHKCHPAPKTGTAVLGRWVVRKFGGRPVGGARPCGRKQGVTSEHQAGRAFDWSADVRRAADRRRVKALLRALFEPDRRGNEDARARRMGVMYVIWADRIYPAWNGFRPEPYLNSACEQRSKCSRTLRHRDHVHVSLDRDGARGRTSWYADRQAPHSARQPSTSEAGRADGPA
ncbi:hypothetical protein [Nocardioides sp. YIM 152315]|uniref:hypothetical protein n=1 Tax=Nocardioides sp. YIM 152315 TaxID=3031760 RepID=UPI0023D9ADC2|nr:hypothetical protein [Nocardioides sp. YIM 152315]MDF1605990.1 hypothetical protein [Nocardioides sp. YIM 152315]